MLKDVLDAFVQLASALAWPSAVLLCAYLVRSETRGILRGFGATLSGGRQLKIGLAPFGIEIGAMPTAPAAETSQVNLPVASEPHAFVASHRGAIEALIQGESVEAATINLSTPSGFLTSRLYATAVLMARQRDTRILAFVHAEGIRGGQYLGACQVPELLRALESQFPEYAAAFALALHNSWWVFNTRDQPQPANQAHPVTVEGNWPASPGQDSTPNVPMLPPPATQLGFRARLPAEDAARVLGSFLESLQVRLASTPDPAPPGWVWLKDGQVLERAEWVTAAWMRERLGPALMRGRVIEGPSAADEVAASHGTHVGLVDDEGRLLELVQRARLLDQLMQGRSGRIRPPEVAPPP